MLYSTVHPVHISNIIIRNNNFFIPKGTDSIEPNDIILVIGRNSKMVKFEQEINKEGK